MFDLVIRCAPAPDIGIEGEQIAAVGPDLPAGREQIDARGLAVLPGMIDVHLHFNEPGRTEWEGAATGSRAFASGGGTLYFDMPLNSSPCTVNGAAFDAKLAALQQSSITDFGLWGGIIPGNRDELEDLAARGVIGFKAFMSDSGLDEFPRSDDVTLYEAMQVAARVGLPVGVHAESEEITSVLTERIRAAGRKDVRAYLDSRPVLAEVEAIERAALLARETGAWLHVVHISSGRGIVAALEARARGTRITIETCAHYLYFTGEDMERIGAAAKCAPPLRSAAERDALWEQLLAGNIDMVTSDHSPSSPDLKKDPDFFRIWGGIAGVESTRAVLLESGHHQRGLALDAIAHLTAATPAECFRIARKGRIAPGYDADLALVDLNAPYTLDAASLFQRHKGSPYAGAAFRGTVRRTILRGRTIYRDGVIMSEAPGRVVRPTLGETSCTS